MKHLTYQTDKEFLKWLSLKMGLNFLKHGLPRMSGIQLWDNQAKVYHTVRGGFLELIYTQYRLLKNFRSRKPPVPKPDEENSGGQ